MSAPSRHETHRHHSGLQLWDAHSGSSCGSPRQSEATPSMWMPQSQAQPAVAQALRRPTWSEATRTHSSPVPSASAHGLGSIVGTQPHALFPSPGRAALPSLKVTAQMATAPLPPAPKSFGNTDHASGIWRQTRGRKAYVWLPGSDQHWGHRNGPRSLGISCGHKASQSLLSKPGALYRPNVRRAFLLRSFWDSLRGRATEGLGQGEKDTSAGTPLTPTTTAYHTKAPRARGHSGDGRVLGPPGASPP